MDPDGGAYDATSKEPEKMGRKKDLPTPEQVKATNLCRLENFS